MLPALFYPARRPAGQVHFACLTSDRLPDPHYPPPLSNVLGAWKQEKPANWNLGEQQCFPRPAHLCRVLCSLPGSQGKRFLSRVLGTRPRERGARSSSAPGQLGGALLRPGRRLLGCASLSDASAPTQALPGEQALPTHPTSSLTVLSWEIRRLETAPQQPVGSGERGGGRGAHLRPPAGKEAPAV